MLLPGKSFEQPFHSLFEQYCRLMLAAFPVAMQRRLDPHLWPGMQQLFEPRPHAIGADEPLYVVESIAKTPEDKLISTWSRKLNYDQHTIARVTVSLH